MKDKKKKYTKKYYTGGRVDMSKGGRVKARVGGIQKAPMNRRTPPMSIEREEEVRPMSIEREEASKKTQPQVTPKQTTRITEQKPVQAQPTSKRGGVFGTLTRAVREQVQQPTVKKPIVSSDKSKSKVVESITESEPVQTSQQTTTTSEKPISTEDTINYYKKAMENNPLGRTGFERNNNKRPPDEITSIERIPTEEELERERLAEERRRAAEEAARKAAESAESIIPSQTTKTINARGETIDVNIPQAQVPQQVEVGKLGKAETIDEREALQARLAEVQDVSEAAQMEAVAAKTPEELQAAQMEAEQIARTPEVEVATGEVVEDALAKAAKVERVAPIEGAEVEIPEGALAERVVGTISEGAKATAALNVGTSLSRITRAKKQLSRAGLSDEDIEEIGNDPEALEDRLADFSEEQRGIIEGLPQEALVSTQMNGLLEGIENGEIPVWARPAVAQVEQMLAQRGMSASTVGRDNLFNAIIQSAMPIAQSNAQAIQQSVSQQKNIEAQTAEANAQRMQQTALTNAQNVFNMDMAQFSADQQTSLSNSKFMQTVGLTEASNRQQATIQNAVLMSQANLAEADFYQQSQIQNAQAFLQMDLTNLNNEQQVNVLKAQQEQQRLLSNQAANNAAAQFNASSENQTQQFMTSIATQVEQFNTAQMNTTAQFNAQQQNAREALEFQVEADLEKANAAMVNQINQFNEQTAFERDKFNTANAQAIEQSNLAWRRQANTINTAAANQVAMQNVQNVFNMTSQAQSFLWQELRDQANYVWQSAENEENRKAQLYAQALANEGGSAKDWKNNVSSIGTLINTIFGGTSKK